MYFDFKIKFDILENCRNSRVNNKIVKIQKKLNCTRYRHQDES